MPVSPPIHQCRSHQEPLAAIAHDARNILSALQLYCDLLSEPGVLAEEHQHFAAELRPLIAAGSGLIGRLAGRSVARGRRSTNPPIPDLSAAVMSLREPLVRLAGPGIALEIECLPCYGRVRLSQEALTRILLNLVRNAVEAMPRGGRIRITVQQGGGASFSAFLDEEIARMPQTVVLCVQDSGPGIAQEQIDKFFHAGFTTKQGTERRGLGLSIVRRLTEAAGGCARAVSLPGQGARFEVELPLIACAGANRRIPAAFPERTTIEC